MLHAEFCRVANSVGRNLGTRQYANHPDRSPRSRRSRSLILQGIAFALLFLIAAPAWASTTGTVSIPGPTQANPADSAAMASAANGAAVASIPGQFAVSPTGAATYSIPIQVPPGTAGMVPNLALSYSSKNRDGIVGWGWTLEGLPAITHCARTAAQDAGVHGGVNYDSNDRFCYGGQRLVLVSGTYGANNSTYRTEIESFLKFVAHSTAGHGPSWFSIKLPSGGEIDLGATTDSQILAVGKTTVAVWAVNKIVDVKGNYLTVTYTDDTTNGQFYPNSINYTANDAASLTAYNSVQFFYNTARVDVTPQYQAGSLVKTTVLLTDIKTYEGANVVYDYKLAYRAGTTIKHSRLTSVTLCDSGTNCLAPTTFGWQGDAGVVSFTAQPSSGLPAYFGILWPIPLGDFNADGLPDAISDTTPGCGPPPTYYPPYYFGSTGGTFTGTVDLGYFCPAAGLFSTALIADFDGNGRSDYVGYPTGGGGLQFYINQATGAGSQMYPISPGYPTSSFLGDFDGDGRTDYYEMASGTAGPLHISNGNGTFGSQAASIPSALFAGDFDGDGCDDVVSWHLTGSGVQDGVTVNYRCNPAVSSATVIDSTLVALLFTPTSGAVGDFNADGKTDVLGYLSTGTGFVAMATAPPAGIVGAADFDGDGRTDVVVDNTAAKQIDIYLSNGNGFTLATSLPYTTAAFFGSPEDWNGDGAADFVFNSTLYYSNYAPEEINTISNGLGATTTITYDRLNKAAVYTKGSGATYPTVDEDDDSVVVSRIDQSNGIGGTYGLTYAYSGAKVDLGGRGFLGFSQVKVTDLQTNIVLTNNYRTDFPYIGALSSQSKTLGTTTLGFITNTFNVSTTPCVSGSPATNFVYLQHTVSNDTSAGVTDLDGTSTWPTINVDYTYDACGDVTQRVLTRSDGSSVTTTNTYTNDTANYRLNQLTETVTNSILGASNLTRTVDYVHNSAGQITQQLIEPGNTTYKLTTVYSRSSTFGIVTQTTQSGVDITSRSPVTLTYDARGEFATTIANPFFSHTLAYSPAFGAVTSDTDPNSLITTRTYDTLGRPTLETRPDGNKTQVTYLYCSGVNGGTTSCPTYGAYLIQVKPLASDGVTQNGPLQTTYYDSLSRVIASDTQSFTATTIRVATQYNANGQVSQTSRPYFTSGGTPKWTQYTYDALGRLTQQTFPDTSDTTYAYHGLTSSVTNDKGQTQTTIRNAEGWVSSVKDALTHATNYTYNSFGELATVTDYAGNVISNTYDLRGNRTATSDPDLGSWAYTYDVLGELKSQTNARSQSTTLTYDKLQRPTQRTETDLTSNWTYDTATNGVGMLASATTTAGYSRAFAYDSLSRPTTTTLTVDSTNYTYTTTYNANGDPDTLTYPSGLALKYFYKSNRYLCKVSLSTTTDTSCSGSNALIWTATTLDAELHLLTQKAGSIVTTQAFDANTGAVQQIRAGTSDAVQNTSFSYDTIGNLTNRSDTIQGWVENFCYDSLNRLTNSAFGASCTATGTKTTAYDALGNITSKSDVGTYSYPATGSARPHAVSSITGTVNGVTNPSFTYDNDGNMTGGAGRSFTWKSYDMAATIIEGTSTLTFTYGADHSRIKMASATDTTLYLNDPISGALEEKFTSGATTTWRDYVRAGRGGIVAEWFNTGGTITKQFLVGDHLGSLTTLATTATAANERDSYDPWGKRRFPNGTDDPTGSITSMASRGFTGHEHLDAMGLINMNARLYDPQIGRFLSADSVIPNPFDSQSLNRYSYVNNGVLNSTDPTGHDGYSIFNELGMVSLASGGGPNLSGVPFTPELEGAQATITNSDGIQTTSAINTAGDLAAAQFALALESHASSGGSSSSVSPYDCATPNKIETVRVVADRKYGYQLYLVAELPGTSPNWTGAGHTFIGFIDPDGVIRALGFYPKNGGLSKIVGPGKVKNDTEWFKRALNDDPDYDYRVFDVDQETFDRAWNFMNHYSDSNEYDVLENSCVTAAFNTLNYAGLGNYFVTYGYRPFDVYYAIKGHQI